MTAVAAIAADSRGAASDRRSRLLLPEGTRLVHIGPHKTGTTAIQSAFDAGRGELARHGVHYAGYARQPMTPVMAVTGRVPYKTGEGPPPIEKWHQLLGLVRGAREPRVVISSESFANADSVAIRRIVEDLDPSRVHVAVTLRPIAKIAPSQWQQYVQAGLRMSFDEWLRQMFGTDSATVTPTFWHRHRHDELIERWAEVVGLENVTVVIVDDRDHDALPRAFEALLGLPDGTLVPRPDLTNRSLTLPEIEVVRAFNIAFKAAGHPTLLHSFVMRRGAVQLMKRRPPSPDEPRIEMPQWALDRAGEIGREIVGNLRTSGVRVIGDLETLAEIPRSRLAGDRQPEVRVSPEITASAAIAMLIACGLGQGRRGSNAAGAPQTEADEREADLETVRSFATRRLAVFLYRRVRSRVLYPYRLVKSRIASTSPESAAAGD